MKASGPSAWSPRTTIGSSCDIGAGETIGSVGDCKGSSSFTWFDTSDDAKGAGTELDLLSQSRLIGVGRTVSPAASRAAPDHPTPPANLTPDQVRTASYGPWEFHTERWEIAYIKRVDATISALKSAGVPALALPVTSVSPSERAEACRSLQ
jgi:hypothetical protein